MRRLGQKRTVAKKEKKRSVGYGVVFHPLSGGGRNETAADGVAHAPGERWQDEIKESQSETDGVGGGRGEAG